MFCAMALLLVIPPRSTLSVKPASENAPAELLKVSELMFQGASTDGKSRVPPAMVMSANQSLLGSRSLAQLVAVVHRSSTSEPPSQTLVAAAGGRMAAHPRTRKRKQKHRARDIRPPSLAAC